MGVEIKLAAIDDGGFRSVMRRHAAGVVVVTAPGDPPAGFTATSFTSVSLHPPLVSFCVSLTASVWPTIEPTGLIAVHVLTARQEDVARIFATHGIDRFAQPATWRLGPENVPLLDGVLAVLICRVVGRVAVGDHVIVIAEALYAEQHTDRLRKPLIYQAGCYHSLQDRRAPTISGW